MKTTFKYIVTAFAVCAALASCNKDKLSGNGNDNPATGQVRVIAATFATSTKSTLGGDKGLTPSFVNGDEIKVSNGTATQVCTVSVVNNVATFITTLTGDLTAVYPSEAAKMGTGDNSNTIVGVNVPATQDGTFAKANIAKATIEATATKATFVNQTALLRFYVDESIGVKSITITSSTENIADGSKTITVGDPDGDTTLDEVSDDDPGKRLCYVSVLPGSFTSLQFTSVTTTQEIYDNNTVVRATGGVTLTANKIYSVFIPYYIDLGDAGKWGYCNIGAFLPEDAGMYFAWGETKGHVPDTDGENAFTFGTNNGGFATDFSNCPYFGGYNNNRGDDQQYHLEPAFTKYIPSNFVELRWPVNESPDNKTVLDASDDAATANWGSVWRMPTMADFNALAELWTDSFNSGVYFEASPKTIFLPAAGLGIGTELYDFGVTLASWSSSLVTTEEDEGPANAHMLMYIPEEEDYERPKIDYSARFCGASVRPVINDATPAPSQNPTETTPEQTVF